MNKKNHKFSIKIKKYLEVFSINALIISLLLTLPSCEIHDPDEPGNLVPRTVDEDSSLPFLEINGTKLHSETYGDPANPVIIVIHGGPGNDYRGMLRLSGLQDGYFVVFYDQKGSGLSRRHDAGDISMDIYMEELDAIIDRYKRTADDQVTLLCHSWGAQIATYYIHKNPQRAMEKIGKLIFSDPGPFIEAWHDYVKADMDITADWVNDLIWNNEFISRDSHIRADYFGFVTHGGNPKRHYSKSDPSPKWRWGMVACYKIYKESANGWDWRPNLSEFTKKILFIRGGLTEHFTTEYIEKQRGCYPNTELHTIEGAGHDLAWVKSEEYMALVRDYMNE